MKLELAARVVSLALLCGGCGGTTAQRPGAKQALFHALVGDNHVAAGEEAAPTPTVK